MKTLLLAGLLLFSTANAELELGSPFSDRMVVQHDEPMVIWGWDTPGQSVSVRFEESVESTQADASGKWQMLLDTPDAGGPYQIEIVGSEQKTLSDVLSGEVWLASGQSNMGWPVKSTYNAQKVIAAAKFPEIRFFKVPLISKPDPQERVNAIWEKVSPETVGPLSGVAYYFAKRLHQKLDMPIGIMQSAWGGSKIQAWIPLDVMNQQPEVDQLREDYLKRKKIYQDALAVWEAGGKQGEKPRPSGGGPNHAVSQLDNAMINPLRPYALKGTIWYQGESDSWSGQIYRKRFRHMVESWREKFGAPEMPFYFVQLPNFNKESARSTWATFRYHQSLIPQELPFTDYAVTIGAGDDNDIHPRNKQTPGNRLAQLALVHDYGYESVASGPIPLEIEKQDDCFKITFERAGSGLELRGENVYSLFKIVTANGNVSPESVEVTGRDTLTLRVPAGTADVKQVVYANFANPKPVLFNKEKLPATPFRFILEGKDRAKFGLLK